MRKGYFIIDDEKGDICLNCGEITLIKFCKKYNGYIGKCTICDVNWRLS